MPRKQKARPLADVMKARSDKPSDVFGQELAWWRKRKGWTQRDLVVQLEERFGVLVDPATVARIETGKRGVSVDEAFLFAATLNVVPSVLFLPFSTGEPVTVAPGSTIHPHLAWKWIVGRGSLATTERLAVRSEEWKESADILFAYEALDRSRQEVNRAKGAVSTAQYVGDEERIQTARAEYVAALEEFVNAVRRLRDTGVPVPDQAASWLEETDRAGIDVEGVEDVFTMTDEEG